MVSRAVHEAAPPAGRYRCLRLLGVIRRKDNLRRFVDAERQTDLFITARLNLGPNGRVKVAREVRAQVAFVAVCEEQSLGLARAARVDVRLEANLAPAE